MEIQLHPISLGILKETNPQQLASDGLCLCMRLVVECSKIFLTLGVWCWMVSMCPGVWVFTCERYISGVYSICSWSQKYVTPRISRMVTGPVQTYNLY